MRNADGCHDVTCITDQSHPARYVDSSSSSLLVYAVVLAGEEVNGTHTAKSEFEQRFLKLAIVGLPNVVSAFQQWSCCVVVGCLMLASEVDSSAAAES
jgi:hypothetical protein